MILVQLMDKLILGNSSTTKDLRRTLNILIKPYEIAIFISQKWLVSII